MKTKNFNNVRFTLYPKYIYLPKVCEKVSQTVGPLPSSFTAPSYCIDQSAILRKQHKYGFYDQITSHALLGFWLRRINQ